MTHRILPSWLGAEKAADLLDYAIDNQTHFEPTKVRFEGEAEARIEERSRRSLVLRDLGPHARFLEDKARGLQEELENAFGMDHAPTQAVELEIAAHADGDYYHPHIDTFTATAGATDINRRLSLVYYFHRLPRRFGGGNLRLLGLGRMPAVAIDPTHDSLLAFPSFLPHAVEEVSGAGGDFADSRFAVNIWLCG
jgi:Rps23 Pro-64 3,4-dihydroxylase Tpa1-like proline 4-hydroxylase